MKEKALYCLIAAVLATGCATDPMRGSTRAWEVEPTMNVRHGMASANAYHQLGRHFLAQRRFDEAENAWLKAIEADGKHADALGALGALYAQRGELERALTLFVRARDAAPVTAHIHNNVGHTLALIGRRGEAIDALRRAVELNPGYQRAWVNLERVAREDGQVVLADEAAARRTTGVAVAGAATRMASAGTIARDKAANRGAQASRWSGGAITRADKAVAAARPEGETSEGIGWHTVPFVPVAGATSATGVTASATVADDDTRSAPAIVAMGRSAADGQPKAPAPDHQPERLPKLAGVPPRELVLPLAARTAVADVPPEHAAPRKGGHAPATAAMAGDRLRVEVLNGNGVNRFASRFAALLRSEGVDVTRVANHETFTVAASAIHYRPGMRAGAEVLRARLAIEAMLVESNGEGGALRLIVGRDALASGLLSV